MSTITREHLRERAREKVKSLEFSITQTAFADSRSELEEELELARVALASLEAEPIYQLVNDDWYDTDKEIYEDVVSYGARGRIVYTAPPVPVSVPDECPTEIRDLMASHSDALFDDEDAQEIWNACRAAMLNQAPVK